MRIAKPPALLITLILFFVVSTALWLKLNHAPPQWDDAWYLTNSLTLFDSLGEGGLPAYGLSYLKILGIKAPLITVLPTPLYLLFGRSVRFAYLVNLFAMPVLLLLLYAIATRLGGERVGLIAVFVAGTMPLLYGLSHWFLVEYWLTVLVCLTIYLVSAAPGRPGLRIYFLLGITCGLGMLLKISFPLYVLPSIAYLFIRDVSESRWSVKSVCAFIAPAILLPLPWYLVNYRQAIIRAFFSGYSNQAAAPFGDSSAFSLPAIGNYLLNVMNAGTSSYYVLLCGAAFIFVFLKRKLPAWWLRCPREDRVLLVLWMLPFPVFLFGRNRDIRFVAPFLPAVALAIASLLDQVIALTTRSKIAFPALLAFPLLAFLHSSFGVLGDLKLSADPLLFAARELHFAAVYDPRHWPHREILDHIVHSTAFYSGERKLVMLGSDLPEFNVNNLELAALSHKLPLQLTTSAYEKDLPTLWVQLYSAAFFVYQDGVEPESRFINRYRNELLDEIHKSGNFRELPCGLRLPDGGLVHIFEKRPRLQAALVPAGDDRVSPYQFDFGGQIQLEGLAFERMSNNLALRLRWRCVRSPDREYRCFVHVLDSDGKLIGQVDHRLLAGNPPLRTLQPDDVFSETLNFPLPPNLRKGAYHLRLGLFDEPSGERLPASIVSAGAGFSLTDNRTAVVTPDAERQAEAQYPPPKT